MKDARGPNKRPDSSGRGAKRLAQGDLWGAEERTGDASWRQVGAEELRSAIDYLTASGYGVTLGITSDGGALSLAVLGVGDKPDKFYFTSGEQFTAFLERVESKLS